MSFCSVSEGYLSQSEDQSPERPVKQRCGCLRSVPWAQWWGARLGGRASHRPTHKGGLPTRRPAGASSSSSRPCGSRRTEGGPSPAEGVRGPGSGLRPCSRHPATPLPSSVPRRVALPLGGSGLWSGPESLPGTQRAGVASHCSPGLTVPPPPPGRADPAPPRSPLPQLSLGPSSGCGRSQFSQPSP